MYLLFSQIPCIVATYTYKKSCSYCPKSAVLLIAEIMCLLHVYASFYLRRSQQVKKLQKIFYACFGEVGLDNS